MNAPVHILLIEPEKEIQNNVSKVLKDNSFHVKVCASEQEGIQTFLTGRFDVIVCQFSFENITGFQVFQKLEAQLIQTGTSFFILSDNFEKQDLIVGLELGIDNFIFYPLDTNSLVKKIKNSIKRKTEVDVVDTFSFQNYFETSKVPMLVAKSGRVELCSRTYKNQFGFNGTGGEGMLVKEVFDLDEDPVNNLSYSKFKNGLLNYCVLKNVKHFTASQLRFDLSVYNIGNSVPQRFFAEIVPSKLANIYTSSSGDIEIGIRKNNGETKKTKIELTKREIEVYKLSAQGLAIKQIASLLNISNRTIEKHRSNIMKKAGAHNIIEAIKTIREQ